MKITSCFIALVIAATPAFAGKKAAGKKHHGLARLDKNDNHQIDGAEIDLLKKAFDKAAADARIKKLDRNSNGKLDDDEIAALNARINSDKKGKKKRK